MSDGDEDYDRDDDDDAGFPAFDWKRGIYEKTGLQSQVCPNRRCTVHYSSSERENPLCTERMTYLRPIFTFWNNFTLAPSATQQQKGRKRQTEQNNKKHSRCCASTD